jgi:endoglucanase
MTMRPINFRLLLTGAALLATSATASAQTEPVSPIKLNQLGLLPDAAKHAVIAHASKQPLQWRLLDSTGRVQAQGVTRVFGDDAASGDHVHLIDFSTFGKAGSGYRLTVGPDASRPFAISDSIYERLQYDALNYFYQNRAGTPIEARFAGGGQWARPAGHRPEKAGCVAGADSQGNRWPGCNYQLDVTGGWYDAGDHGKYVVNGGIALWTLLNLYERQQAAGLNSAFADGKAALPERGNGINDLLDEARWEMEFLLAMQVPEGTRASVPVGVKRTAPGMRFTEIDASGMAHHKVADEKWTSLPMAPHLDPEKRQLFPPSTAATLNLAATAAQCARIWRGIDAAFSRRCLVAAERAFAAARRNPEVYAIADFTGSGGYGDGELSDEFYWAAAELFITTGKADYEQAVRSSPHFRASPAAELSWPRVASLGTISLALLPSRLPPGDVAALRAGLVAAAESFLKDGERVGYRVPYLPANGYPWGSNSSILNRAIVLALAHQFTGDRRYRDGVVDAMDYVLGRNPLDQSYVSGYGARPMLNPHHRFWARQADAKFPPPPPGALSGGPNSTSMSDDVAGPLKGKCAPQRCYRDHINAFSLNEVAVNWNAPLVWVAAYLDERR